MIAVTYMSYFQITQLWNCLLYAAPVCTVIKAWCGSLYLGVEGGEAVHCVEWIEKKLGSATKKGGTPFVNTNFMYLRRDSRMEENSSQSRLV